MMPLDSRRIKRFTLISLIASLCLCGLVGIIILIMGRFGVLEQKILVSTIIFAGYSILGLCCSIPAGKSKNHLPVTYAGIAICITGLIYSVVFTWAELDSYGSYFGKILGILTVLAVASAHCSLLLIVPAARKLIKGIVTEAIASALLVWLMVIYTICTDGDFPFNSGAFFRIMGIFGILAVLGTISAPVLAKAIKAPEPANETLQ